MGNDNKKPPPKVLSIEEQCLEMKMAAKRFENDSKRANKEAQKQVEKARVAVKKGMEEDARLYLTQAGQKQKEATQLHRMANKVDFIAGNIKNQANNQQMQNMISGIIPVMQQQLSVSDNLLQSNNIQIFDEILTKMEVNQRVFDDLTNPNLSNDQMDIENNLHMLKNEMYADMHKDANLNTLGQFQPIQQNQNFQTKNSKQQKSSQWKEKSHGIKETKQKNLKNKKKKIAKKKKK